MNCVEIKKLTKTFEDTIAIDNIDLSFEKCNDTFVHNMGDEYIMSCAEAIQEAFLMVGNCYRIGGDEFSIIARNVSDETIENCYCMLGAKINIYNLEHPEMRMSVAYGHASYDPEMDEDIKDTRERADKIMYKNKMDIKKVLGAKQQL